LTEIQNMPREEQNKLLNMQPRGRRRRGGRRRSARDNEINDVVV
jgi:DNA-binding NtrC family response regulator